MGRRDHWVSLTKGDPAGIGRDIAMGKADRITRQVSQYRNHASKIATRPMIRRLPVRAPQVMTAW